MSPNFLRSLGRPCLPCRPRNPSLSPAAIRTLMSLKSLTGRSSDLGRLRKLRRDRWCCTLPGDCCGLPVRRWTCSLTAQFASWKSPGFAGCRSPGCRVRTASPTGRTDQPGHTDPTGQTGVLTVRTGPTQSPTRRILLTGRSGRIFPGRRLGWSFQFQGPGRRNFPVCPGWKSPSPSPCQNCRTGFPWSRKWTSCRSEEGAGSASWPALSAVTVSGIRSTMTL